MRPNLRPGPPRVKLVAGSKAWAALGVLAALGCAPTGAGPWQDATVDQGEGGATPTSPKDAGTPDAASPEGTSSRDGGTLGCALQDLTLSEQEPEREAPTLGDELELPSDFGKLSDVQVGVAAYVLNLEASEFLELSPEEVAARTPDGPAVARALTLSATGEGESGLRELRRVLHAQQACADYPATLDELVERWGDFRAVDPLSLLESQVTRHERRIYNAAALGLYVAQALDRRGRVLETELIHSGARSDGALQYLVFDERGRRNDAAQLFLSGEVSNVPAPFTCMVCHRTFGTPRFDVIDPSKSLGVE
jgi:hypothetical protein